MATPRPREAFEEIYASVQAQAKKLWKEYEQAKKTTGHGLFLVKKLFEEYSAVDSDKLYKVQNEYINAILENTNENSYDIDLAVESLAKLRTTKSTLSDRMSNVASLKRLIDFQSHHEDINEKLLDAEAFVLKGREKNSKSRVTLEEKTEKLEKLVREAKVFILAQDEFSKHVEKLVDVLSSCKDESNRCLFILDDVLSCKIKGKYSQDRSEIERSLEKLEDEPNIFKEEFSKDGSEIQGILEELEKEKTIILDRLAHDFKPSLSEGSVEKGAHVLPAEA